jgi:ADP-ribose pyrophosphatase
VGPGRDGGGRFAGCGFFAGCGGKFRFLAPPPLRALPRFMLVVNRRLILTTLSTGLRTPHLLPRSGIRFNSMSSSSDLPRVDFSQTETVGSTRWMRLETLSYHVAPDPNDASGDTLRKWDRAVRTTKKSEDAVDAVVILAILRYDLSDPSKDEIVCVKQFRPPVNGYTIELPAGLIDPNEDPAAAAEREFKEETGYIGKVLSVSPPSYLSPGLTNESACMVKMEVDMTLEHNAKNHERTESHDGLEGCEKDRGLEKLLLPKVGFLNALHDLQKKDGVKIFAALYSLAVGMSVNEGAQV